MMNRLSIRWKLTVWYGAAVALILAVFCAAVYALMGQHLLGLTDAALAEELADLGGDVSRCASEAGIPRELAVRYSSHEGYEFQVARPGGQVLFRSEGLGAAGLPLPAAAGDDADFATVAVAGLGRTRLATRSIAGPAGPLTIQSAIGLGPNDQALRQLLLVFLLAGPLALLAALGGGYLLARTALAPVDRMTAAAAQITATRLDRRLGVPRARDELGRLAWTFNDMISRLQRSFEEVRRFTTDAAHELRTPLAVMRTEAEVALRSPREPEADRRVLENLLEELERLGRLVEQLLFLCREDAGLPTGPREPSRLDELARDVTGHMQTAAREKGLSLSIQALTPCLVHGDADRLRQLLFNLLDNAVKYTPPGGAVRVQVDTLDDRARVVVEDTGIGIPAEHLNRVFDRFYRADPSRSPEKDGTGLGLAICRSIVEAHGGEIHIHSLAGHGTSVVLFLPARPHEMAHSDRATVEAR
jgi:two-component system heavy metal sensor histidine kinase CusS